MVCNPLTKWPYGHCGGEHRWSYAGPFTLIEDTAIYWWILHSNMGYNQSINKTYKVSYSICYVYSIKYIHCTLSCVVWIPIYAHHWSSDLSGNGLLSHAFIITQSLSQQRSWRATHPNWNDTAFLDRLSCISILQHQCFSHLDG